MADMTVGRVIPAVNSGNYPLTEKALDKQKIVRCKDCRYGQHCTDGETTYQCFKWNSNEFGAVHEQDWFCADGMRKDRDPNG